MMNLNELTTPIIPEDSYPAFPHTVVVLGNGYDLDLGMKTSYQDFAKSVFWPFIDQTDINTLPGYLNAHLKQTETWFDLEEELSLYAQHNEDNSDASIKEDIKNLKILTESLSSYLKDQQNLFIQNIVNGYEDPPSAYVFLKELIRRRPLDIYTFNFTDIESIIKSYGPLKVELSRFIEHVHGSIKSNNAILGAGDCRELNNKYFQFYKSANPAYKSTNLVYALSKADEVYIFGHSLGQNDHDYFLDFFNRATHYEYSPFSSSRIKLRIFTKDSKSEINLKKQLRKLTGNHLIGLFAHCDFKIYKNDTTNDKKKWMKEMEEDTVEWRREMNTKFFKWMEEIRERLKEKSENLTKGDRVNMRKKIAIEVKKRIKGLKSGTIRYEG